MILRNSAAGKRIPYEIISISGTPPGVRCHSSRCPVVCARRSDHRLLSCTPPGCLSDGIGNVILCKELGEKLVCCSLLRPAARRQPLPQHVDGFRSLFTLKQLLVNLSASCTTTAALPLMVSTSGSAL